MPIRLTENERLRVKLAEAEAEARAYYLAWQEAIAERNALRAYLESDDSDLAIAAIIGRTDLLPCDDDD